MIAMKVRDHDQIDVVETQSQLLPADDRSRAEIDDCGAHSGIHANACMGASARSEGVSRTDDGHLHFGAQPRRRAETLCARKAGWRHGLAAALKEEKIVEENKLVKARDAVAWTQKSIKVS